MVTEASTDSVSEHAGELHGRAVVIDGTAYGWGPDDWGPWISGGATVAVPTVAIRTSPAQTLQAIARWRSWLREDGDIALVTSTADILRLKRDGRLGLVLAFQDASPIEWDLGLIGAYYDLGVRMIGLCYNFRNRLGDGCAEPSDTGLSLFGRDAVREMERVGIVVDCSHAGDHTSLEVARMATKPLVCSHSNPRATRPGRRNITDELALAIAEKDGLVGLGSFPPWVSERAMPTIDDWLDQLDYWVRLIGPDHVGIGLDLFPGATVVRKRYDELLRDMWFEPEYPPPPYRPLVGLEDASKLPEVTQGLVRRGYAEETILKILGGNWMRVFRASWGQ
jgi:membrane dipeptidase